MNHYSLLGIAQSSDQSSIEQAYARFKSELNLYAPGVAISEADIEKQFPEIWKAYHELLDPEKRREYDGRLMLSETEPDAVAAIEESGPEPVFQKVKRILSYIAFVTVLLGAIYFLVGFFAF